MQKLQLYDKTFYAYSHRVFYEILRVLCSPSFFVHPAYVRRCLRFEVAIEEVVIAVTHQDTTDLLRCPTFVHQFIAKRSAFPVLNVCAG